jgi:hypothetical protein
MKVFKKTLPDLRVTNTTIDDVAARSVEGFLATTALETLEFDSVLFTGKAFEMICAGISQCVTLASITFTHCGLDDEDAGSVSQAILRARGEVTNLDLSHNKLMNPSYFVETQQHNKHLQVLDLSYNKLSPDVLPQLELALQAYWPELRQVFLKVTGLNKVENGLSASVDERSDTFPSKPQIVF